MQGNEISYNNTGGFFIDWEGGGTKWALTTNLIVRENYVHHNTGPGLWTDINNSDVLYENNVVEWNTREGIKHEISYHAVIRNNIVGYNGRAKDVWLWGAQILVQNSRDVHVYDNDVTVAADASDGIAIINQNRYHPTQSPTPYLTANNRIVNNVIRYMGMAGSSGIVDDSDGQAAVTGAHHNVWDANLYLGSGGFLSGRRWDYGPPMSWADFQAADQEPNGTTTPTD